MNKGDDIITADDELEKVPDTGSRNFLDLAREVPFGIKTHETMCRRVGAVIG